MKELTIKQIPGYEGYYAGEDGRIWVPLKGGLDSKKKYRQVMARGSATKGKFKTNRVHRLVCSAFHGLPKGEDTVSHIDGNKENNQPTNLIWEPMSANHKRKLTHGTDDRGYKNSRAKLNRPQIQQMREMISRGYLTHEKIGTMFGVSRLFVTKVANGYRYKGQGE